MKRVSERFGQDLSQVLVVVVFERRVAAAAGRGRSGQGRSGERGRIGLVELLDGRCVAAGLTSIVVVVVVVVEEEGRDGGRCSHGQILLVEHVGRVLLLLLIGEELLHQIVGRCLLGRAGRRGSGRVGRVGGGAVGEVERLLLLEFGQERIERVLLLLLLLLLLL